MDRSISTIVKSSLLIDNKNKDLIMKNISLLVLSLSLLAACEKTFLQGSNLSSESKATTLDDCESIKKIGSSYVVESDHAVVQVFSTVGGGTIDYSMGSLITPTVVSEFKFIVLALHLCLKVAMLQEVERMVHLKFIRR